MVTYGSYLSKRDNIISTCIPITVGDTIVSFFAAIAVFSTVFAVGLEPDVGVGLFFHTFPMVFSKLPGGYLWAVLFFIFVLLSALTSQISVMEPFIAYLIDDKGWKRRSAASLCGLGALLLGIPCALSANILKTITFDGVSIIDTVQFLAQGIFIPIGGLLAVLLVGWKWGLDKALVQLNQGSSKFFDSYPVLNRYLRFTIKYSAPVLIVLVLADAIYTWASR